MGVAGVDGIDTSETVMAEMLLKVYNYNFGVLTASVDLSLKFVPLSQDVRMDFYS